MNYRTPSTFRLLTAGALLAASALFALSITDAGAQTSRAVSIPHINLNTPHVHIEAMPEDSPLRSIRHIQDDFGQEISRENFYKNGDFETVTLRADGTEASSHLENRFGAVIVDVTYADDGSTVIGGYQKRADGSLLRAVDSKNGVITTTTRWWDGTLFSRQVVQPDGSYVTEYRHKNGKLWMRRSGPNINAVSREEDFDSTTGQLAYIRELSGNSIIISTLRTDGTVKLRQTAGVSQNIYTGQAAQTLNTIEEFAADGKTLLRKTSMDSSSSYGYYYGNSQRYPSIIEIHNADGTTTVHQVARDGTVTLEQQLDDKRNIVSTHSWISGDPATPKETVDQSLTAIPDTANPPDTWQGTEDNDYSRSPDL
jgi:hypothetical protein